MGKAADAIAAIIIGAAFSSLAYAPESEVRTDCEYWAKAFQNGSLLNVINKPLRVAPYYAKWWEHEGVFACHEVEKLKSESFYGFIEIAVEYIIEEYL